MRVGHFPHSFSGNHYVTLFADAIENEGNEVVRIPPTKWFALQHAISFECDILHLEWPHDWYNGKNLLTRLIKRWMYYFGLRKLKNQTCVWTAHNLVAHDSADPEYERAMIQKLISVCDGIVVMSELSKQQLEATYDLNPATKVKIVPHGHYIGLYPNSTSMEEARRKLDLDEGKVVLSLGRLLPYKGIEDLITAFAKSGIGDKRTLLLAGACTDASYHEKLRSLVDQYSTDSSRIVLHAKFIEEDELQYYYAAANVVALPFKNILNSGSVLLAMSFGKVIIAPREGSIAEVVFPDGWYDYDAVEDGLAKSLDRSLQLSDDERMILEKSIFDFTESRYSWANTGKLVCNLYNEILAATR